MEGKVLKCDNCGEPLSGFNPGLSYCKCKYCNSINFIFDDNKVNQLDLARSDLMLFKFDEADLIYKKLIDENDDNPELLAKCYEGRIKATLGICYIKSFSENTYKPTFTHYVPSIKSIYDLDECKKLFSLKLKDTVRKEYQERIEEWDKAYKNIAKQLKEKPDYDVFICTKISLKTKDNPNAIGYTEDFKEALTLYNELKECGYKVFLSSECVKGGIDSDAEIFSALTKSRSLLVIGSKQEYLESAWVESEWRRWLYFIDHKQKETKSIFLYTCGIDLKLPMIMDQKRIQRSKSSLDLINTIKDYLVIRGETTLGTIDFKEKPITKKIRTKENVDKSEQISVQKINDNTNLEIDKQLDDVEIDLPTLRRKNAIKTLKELAKSNPNYSRIIALNILVKYGLNRLTDLYEPNIFENIKDLNAFKTILENGGSKEFLYSILDILYNYLKNSNNEEKSLKVLKIVLPYEYSKRKELIDQLYDNSFQKIQGDIFCILLSQKEFSNEQEIDEIIRFSKIALNNYKFEVANKTANKVLNDYEEGNKKAKAIAMLSNYKVIDSKDLFTPKNVVQKSFIDELTDVISYFSEDERFKSLDIWNEIILSNCYSMNDNDFIKFYDEYLRFYPQEKNGTFVQKDRIQKAAKLFHQKGEYQKAIHYYEFLVGVSEDPSKIYWQMMLCDLMCLDESDLYGITISIKENKYYNQAYKLVERGSEFEKHIQEVRRKQLDAIENINRTRKSQKKARIEQITGDAKEKAKKIFKICFRIGPLVLLLFLIVTSILSLFGVSVFSTLYAGISISIFRKSKIEYFILPFLIIIFGFLIFIFISKIFKKLDYLFIGISYAIGILIVGGGIYCNINCKKTSSNIIIDDDCLIKLIEGDNEYQVDRILLTSRNASVSIPEEYNNKPIKYLGTDMIKNNEKWLKDVNIPNSVISIGDYAFSRCKSLSSIVIPDSVITIGNGAFKGCKSLTSIEIPDSVTSIFHYAFKGCSSLTSISIPNSLIGIGDNAFEECSSLYKVYFNGTIEDWCKIGLFNTRSNPMFYASNFYILNGNNKYEKVTEIIIPNTITSVGNNQFCGFNVTKVTLPDSITTIGDYAFAYCYSLSSINIPNSVTTIVHDAFNYCSSLTSIIIPSTVRSIGGYTFSHCDSLTIYCEVSSRPSEWSSKWNKLNLFSNCKTIWGYLEQ